MAAKKKYDPAQLHTDPLYGPLMGAGAAQDGQETTKGRSAPATLYSQDKPQDGETPKEQRARLKKSVVNGLASYRGNQDGIKLARIGMGFLPETYDFIRVMSKAEGVTMTAYINLLVALELERRGDKYNTLKEVIDGDDDE